MPVRQGSVRDTGAALGTPDEAFRTAEAEDASLPDHAERRATA